MLITELERNADMENDEAIQSLESKMDSRVAKLEAEIDRLKNQVVSLESIKSHSIDTVTHVDISLVED